VHHNPNPQLCALRGGVWDDSVLINPTNFGGRCITREMAESLQTNNPGLEVSDACYKDVSTVGKRCLTHCSQTE